MEANLRIIKSIQKINEDVLETKDNQNKLIDKQNKLEIVQEEVNNKLDNVIEDQQRLSYNQESFEKIVDEKIEKVKLDKPKDGKDGRNGLDGKNGRDGKDGQNGRDGRDGKNGLNGKDGKDGQDGVDGIGIYNVEINKKGELIVTLTNGRKINCGNVKGKDGIGWAGISVTDAKIVDNRLIITLSTGRKIDAGKVRESEEPFVEEDPVFTNSVAYNITDDDVTNWNNKSELKTIYYQVRLNPDGTIAEYSEDLKYLLIKEQLNDTTKNVCLDVIQDNLRFFVNANEEMVINNGPIKFIGIYNKDGNKVLIEFNLYSNDYFVNEFTLIESLWNKVQDIVVNSTNTVTYPSTKAVYEQFERKPVLIYDKANKLHIPGIITEGTDSDNGLLNQNQGEGTNRNITSWNITGMDLSEFKYIRVVFSRNDITSAVTGEFDIPLDGDYITNGNLNAYVSGISMPYYAVRTRLVGIGCAISSDKTSFTVTQTISLTATTLGMVATTVNDLYVTKIEGYY